MDPWILISQQLLHECRCSYISPWIQCHPSLQLVATTATLLTCSIVYTIIIVLCCILYHVVFLTHMHAVLGLQSIISRLHAVTSDSDLITLLTNWEQQRMRDQELMESAEGFNPEDPQDVFDHLIARVSVSTIKVI